MSHFQATIVDDLRWTWIQHEKLRQQQQQQQQLLQRIGEIEIDRFTLANKKSEKELNKCYTIYYDRVQEIHFHRLSMMFRRASTTTSGHTPPFIERKMK